MNEKQIWGKDDIPYTGCIELEATREHLTSDSDILFWDTRYRTQLATAMDLEVVVLHGWMLAMRINPPGKRLREEAILKTFPPIYLYYPIYLITQQI